MVGDILKKARLAKGMTQREVAEKAYISERLYSKIETGSRRLTIGNLARVCHVLDLSVDEVGELTEPQFFGKRDSKRINSNGKKINWELTTKLWDILWYEFGGMELLSQATQYTYKQIIEKLTCKRHLELEDLVFMSDLYGCKLDDLIIYEGPNNPEQLRRLQYEQAWSEMPGESCLDDIKNLQENALDDLRNIPMDEFEAFMYIPLMEIKDFGVLTLHLVSDLIGSFLVNSKKDFYSCLKEAYEKIPDSPAKRYADHYRDEFIRNKATTVFEYLKFPDDWKFEDVEELDGNEEDYEWDCEADKEMDSHCTKGSELDHTYADWDYDNPDYEEYRRRVYEWQEMLCAIQELIDHWNRK